MTLDQVMEKLASLGSEQTKKTFLRHGAQEPFFGVKVGDLKKLVKDVKKDQDLARALYATGNSDAMYLAGLTIHPATVTKEELQTWVKVAYWYMLAEYTVAGLVAESRYGLELAREWIEADAEMVAACGWSVYANVVSVVPDEQLPVDELLSLLQRVEATVHDEQNRVRYAMNGFVISVGTYVVELAAEAARVAAEIGKVSVDMGDTACKVPLAAEYIAKTAAAGKAGTKKKTCIC